MESAQRVGARSSPAPLPSCSRSAHVARMTGRSGQHDRCIRVQFCAGRVATTRSPQILHDVNERTVANPILLRRGLRSLAAVPLLVADELVGVLHVGSEAPRFFDNAALAMLQDAGKDIAIGLHIERTETERAGGVGRASQSLAERAPPRRRCGNGSSVRARLRSRVGR